MEKGLPTLPPAAAAYPKTLHPGNNGKVLPPALPPLPPFLPPFLLLLRLLLLYDRCSTPENLRSSSALLLLLLPQQPTALLFLRLHPGDHQHASGQGCGQGAAEVEQSGTPAVGEADDDPAAAPAVAGGGGQGASLAVRPAAAAVAVVAGTAAAVLTIPWSEELLIVVGAADAAGGAAAGAAVAGAAARWGSRSNTTRDRCRKSGGGQGWKGKEANPGYLDSHDDEKRTDDGAVAAAVAAAAVAAAAASLASYAVRGRASACPLRLPSVLASQTPPCNHYCDYIHQRCYCCDYHYDHTAVDGGGSTPTRPQRAWPSCDSCLPSFPTSAP